MKKKKIIIITTIVLIILIPIIILFVSFAPQIIPRPLHIDDSFTELSIAESQNDTRTVFTFYRRAGVLNISTYNEVNGGIMPPSISEKELSLTSDEFDYVIESVNKYRIPVCNIESFGQLDCKRNTLLLSPELLISTSNDSNSKLSKLYDELLSKFYYN